MLADRFEEEETVSIMSIVKEDYKTYVRMCERNNDEPLSYEDYLYFN